MIDRSAIGMTVVDSAAVLFAPFGSISTADTVAVLLIVPPSDGAVTVSVMSGAAPTVRLALVQVTAPAWAAPEQSTPVSQLQPAPDACGPVTPAGRVSRTHTEVAGSGPALLTESVYVSVASGSTWSGLPNFTIDR